MEKKKKKILFPIYTYAVLHEALIQYFVPFTLNVCSSTYQMKMTWHDSSDKAGASRMKKMSTDSIKWPEWK